MPAEHPAIDARTLAEARTQEAMDRAVRKFLAALAAHPGLIAGALTLGEVVGMWQRQVEEYAIPGIRVVWEYGWGYTTTTPLPAEQVIDAYLRTAADKLVRGITPPLPDEAFTLVKEAVSTGAQLGWGAGEVARRVAAELSWEQRGPYWRSVWDKTGEHISRILDPLGPPGTAAREAARLSDPTVARLQADRALARRRLDAEHSYWRTRANAIARTETTRAWNYAAHEAIVREGGKRKQWISALLTDTRDDHRAAHGQVVPVGESFEVGGYPMMYPGDSSAPAREVVNCVCSVINPDS